MSEITKFLGVSELFRDISQEDLSEVEKFLKEEKISQGEEVFKADDLGDNLYILYGGRVRISIRADMEDKTEEQVDTIQMGEIFGEFSFIDGGQRSAGALALEDSTVLILTREDFENFSQEKPYIALAMMHNFAWILTEKLRSTNMLWRKEKERTDQ